MAAGDAPLFTRIGPLNELTVEQIDHSPCDFLMVRERRENWLARRIPLFAQCNVET
jgi:hypothetical protein